jgi:hypothetical protein
MSIIYPAYFRLVKRDAAGWHFRRGKVFYNSSIQPLDHRLEDREKEFGLSDRVLIAEFCWLNGGKEGYYLANLRDREYYYCGTERQDVKNTLVALGINYA